MSNASCANCAPRPLPVYYVADGSRVASRIGSAGLTAPAATPGALWLVSYRRGADMSTAAGNAQEVSVTGATLGPRLRLPAGYVIDRGTRACYSCSNGQAHTMSGTSSGIPAADG